MNDPVQSRSFSLALGLALRDTLRLERRPVVALRAGTPLIQAGAVVRKLPLLLAGRIDTVMHQRSAHDAPVLPVSFLQGELVLMSQLFTRRPSVVDLVAATPVRVQWIGVAELERTLSQDPQLLMLLVKFLGQRLREAQVREKTWIERSVSGRVSSLLARLASTLRAEPGGARVIHATHEEIAIRCGVSRPKASSALKQLERAGALRLGRGRIEVIDPEAFGSA